MALMTLCESFSQSMIHQELLGRNGLVGLCLETTMALKMATLVLGRRRCHDGFALLVVGAGCRRWRQRTMVGSGIEWSSMEEGEDWVPSFPIRLDLTSSGLVSDGGARVVGDGVLQTAAAQVDG